MRGLSLGLAAMISLLALSAPPASAALGLHDFDVTFIGSDGTESMQAGSHPFEMKLNFAADTFEEEGETFPLEAIKELELGQVVGLAGIPGAVPPCATVDFLALRPGIPNVPECADSAAVGIMKVEVGNGNGKGTFTVPLYSLQPPPGDAAKFGFWVQSAVVTVEIAISESPPYNVLVRAHNISQLLEFFGSESIIWGVPASPSHDDERGLCYDGSGNCTAGGIPEVPFLILPRACEGPLQSTWKLDSWENPSFTVRGGTLTHDDLGNPRGMSGCGSLDFAPRIAAQPTSRSAESPSGFDVDLEINDEGIAKPMGIADSDMRKTVVTLPEGMTINPSQAEGLVACSEEQLEEESANSAPGEGCPQASKVGTVDVQSPLVPEKTFKGELFVATPYKNPFNSLIAVYLTIREPELGVSVKLAGKVQPDPLTGKLISTFDDLPQFPVSHVHLHLREGGRSPLVTPPHCGTYTTKAIITPWANPATPHEATSDFQITSGVGGGPCPPGGIPPFRPGFSAGSLSNKAKSYSPFHMRLTRADGEQDITRFSAVLPPGETGKLTGVSKCPDEAIGVARARRGEEELVFPSCPANSQLGHTIAAAGVGGSLVYVPGNLYLAGPYKGHPLSVVAITPGVAGPFDTGTVVVRVAFDLNRATGEVEVDGATSDPFPHILQGIVLKVRDIRVGVDRPLFTLNPTSCEPLSTRATLFGSFLDVFNSADDAPVSLADRFQAADCAALGFKPKLALRLKGGTHRGDHPSFITEVTPRSQDANFAGAVVTLPRSAFLDQSHIRTICTRVQFAANSCPPGSIYGHARAITPLVDGPAEGPVYLRSSNHVLPDLVVALKGPPSAAVDLDLVGRIDSHKGGIRGSFESIPDFPVTKFVLTMRGGKKGLIVNSRSLCTRGSHAIVRLSGQNGREHDFNPLVKAAGCKNRDHR